MSDISVIYREEVVALREKSEQIGTLQEEVITLRQKDEGITLRSEPEIISLRALQGIPLATFPPSDASRVVKLAFDYTTTSPNILTAVTSVEVLSRVDVVVLTPFDDAAAVVKAGIVGDDGCFLDSGEVNTSRAATYSAKGIYCPTSPENIILTIEPGTSSAGSGLILLHIDKV